MTTIHADYDVIQFTGSQSGFTVFPTNQVVPSEAQEAIFYCRFPAAESIGWRVDGSSLGRMPRMGIIPCTNPRPDGVVIDRLKVEVDPDYMHNGITVECVAFVIGGSAAISEPANLTIQGMQCTCRCPDIVYIIIIMYTLMQLMQHLTWVRCMYQNPLLLLLL